MDINFLGDKNRCLVKWGGRDEEIWMEPRHIGMNMLDVFMLHRDYKKGTVAFGVCRKRWVSIMVIFQVKRPAQVEC